MAQTIAKNDEVNSIFLFLNSPLMFHSLSLQISSFRFYLFIQFYYLTHCLYSFSCYHNCVATETISFPNQRNCSYLEILILTKHPYNKPDSLMFDTISLWPLKNFLRREPIIRPLTRLGHPERHQCQKIGEGFLLTLKKQFSRCVGGERKENK